MVTPAVVPHHRIHHNGGFLSAEGLNELLHNADLPLTAQKAAVHRVEPETQGFPVGGYLHHFVGHVQKGEALESAGVGGQKGRG